MSGASAELNAVPFLKAFADLGLGVAGLEIERGVAHDIVGRAKTLVHVDSGDTRDSLDIQGEGPNWIDVGSLLPKAFYEEFGAYGKPGVAFLRIAIAEAMGGKGGFGVSWKGMHRPPHSRNRKK